MYLLAGPGEVFGPYHIGPMLPVPVSDVFRPIRVTVHAGDRECAQRMPGNVLCIRVIFVEESAFLCSV